MLQPRPNRRRAERIRLSKPFVCRLGSHGIVLIDISNYGARIEHYTRLERGSERTLRLRWNEEPVAMPAEIVSCRIERFVPGDQGLTVYRSGLRFLQESGPEFEKIKRMTSAYRAGALVEQVANAKGFAPPTRGEMPIFRDGTLATNRYDVDARNDEHLLPERELARKVGFVRFWFEKNRWQKKWTLDPNQPQEGFTVSANEAWEQIESLCHLYQTSNEEGRNFIRLLAEASVESELERAATPRPLPRA